MSDRVRPEVENLVLLGQLPAESEVSQTNVDELAVRLDQFHRAIKAIERPVTTEEARALLAVFGPDDSFGASWTLLHLVETAPELPIGSEPATDANEWVRRLWDRAHR